MVGQAPEALMSRTLLDSYAVDVEAIRPADLPNGCNFIGALNSDTLGTGTLVQLMSSGRYALLSGNSIILLDQIAVDKELNKLNGIEDELDEEKSFLLAGKKGLFRNADDEIDLN